MTITHRYAGSRVGIHIQYGEPDACTQCLPEAQSHPKPMMRRKIKHISHLWAGCPQMSNSNSNNDVQRTVSNLTSVDFPAPLGPIIPTRLCKRVQSTTISYVNIRYMDNTGSIESSDSLKKTGPTRSTSPYDCRFTKFQRCNRCMNPWTHRTASTATGAFFLGNKEYQLTSTTTMHS